MIQKLLSRVKWIVAASLFFSLCFTFGLMMKQAPLVPQIVFGFLILISAMLGMSFIIVAIFGILE